MGDKNILISTDVVDADIPLLLSKEAMQNANTRIDFAKDKISMFGTEQKVFLTQSGHYAIPLNNSQKVLRSLEDKRNAKLVL